MGSSKFLLDENRDGTERASQRERPDIAHEDFGRVRVVPKESEARADERPAENRQLGGLRKMNEEQVLGKNTMACDIRQGRERSGRDRKGADCQAIEAVGQVYRV